MSGCVHSRYRCVDGVWSCKECGALVEPPSRSFESGFPSIRWIGGGFYDSKDGFHGQTLRERQTQWLKEGRSAGLDPVPMGG